jgi:ABC-type transporter Mla subunit MlaD
MNNEEFEKKMEFILEQQAQFASDIGELKDVVARLANASLKRFDDVDEKIAALVDSQIRLTEAQSHTDENLRNLISVVDRYFSEGRNGKSEG